MADEVMAPAWEVKPSWYLVATDDRMIPPPAQRAMAARAGAKVTEVNGSHAVYVSRPEAVAALIAKAATSVSKATRKGPPRAMHLRWAANSVVLKQPFVDGRFWPGV